MNDTLPTILVVDDEIDTCRNLQDILADLGYRVDVAHDGPSALELVRHKHYDVALLDYLMPGMDGLTLYREIKKLSAGTVAIVVTAYAGGTTTEEAQKAGAWQVLPKPVDFRRLLALVEEAVGQPLVLIVDDDPDLCASLRDVLEERGYRVCLAHDVRTAAEQLHAGDPFAVILLDMTLPDGDGTEVFREARRANPRKHSRVGGDSRSHCRPLQRGPAAMI